MECDEREDRRKTRLVREAGFPRPKRLDDFDFTANPLVDPGLIHTLAKGAWIRAGQPLCLIGDSGTGKSHLLIGLGIAAAEAGYRVRYVTAAALVNELVEAADDKHLSRTIARYGRVDLLCLDELGYLRTRPPRRRAAVPGVHRTRGTRLHRGRVELRVLRMGPHLHRPPALRRDRRPHHLRSPHRRNRHRVLPAAHHPAPPRQTPDHTRVREGTSS